ncbi:MAG: cobalt-precorrin 5A hydrolase [Clostridiaceae bacterium]|nr:cobalt-precorrin 5A hydrolase [Clostridiaceae bacterium]
MKIAAIAFTDRGMEVGERLRKDFDMTLAHCPEGGLSLWTETNFMAADALLFIGAAGIAVRAVAPYIRSKTADPAVVVMDELGSYAIPLLSGHIGGANDLAVRFARCAGALPVITTATDINGVFAVDSWAKSQGLTIANPERIKWISARLLAGETIRIKSLFPVVGNTPPGVVLGGRDYDVLITYRRSGKAGALRLIAPAVILGIGCKRGIDADTIEAAFKRLMGKTGCSEAALCCAASIDRKAVEPGILEFCRRHGLPFHTFSAAELAEAPGKFSASEFVKNVTGVDNVCERSAVLAGGRRLLAKKEAGSGVTMALAVKELALSFMEEA